MRRADALGVQTIAVDIWTTLLPPNGFTAQTVWLGSAPPDTRILNRTAQFNLPFDVTLLNATTYLVRKGLLEKIGLPRGILWSLRKRLTGAVGWRLLNGGIA